jgi:colanic acid biosynthesis glycosyl transferase WcaI
VHLQDHSGHSFPAQLSRHLARNGHDVSHAYSAQFQSPHGRLELADDDPSTLRIQPMSAAVPFVKYSPLHRTRYELSYAKTWQEHLDREVFDVVVACNVPLFTLSRMRRFFARRRQPWVLWHQDVYSRAIADEAARALPRRVAPAVGRAVQRLERAQVAHANAVIAIDNAFVAEYGRWNLTTDHVTVIPNWAPIDEVTPGPRDNSWPQRHGLPATGIRLMYAGTLGRKHNPLLLLELLDAVRARGVEATLVVVSEGVGADDLAAAAGARSDVRILPYQSASEVSDMLASADVMIALLEPSAAQFSVPSKVLSYLAAGRPTIALLPKGNAAAVDVRDAGGFVAPPTVEGAKSAADWLTSVGDAASLTALGVRARQSALRRFDIERIGAEFEKVLSGVADGVVAPTFAAS